MNSSLDLNNDQPTTPLTADEEMRVIEILAKLSGEGFSDALYTALARIMPQPSLEVTFFRENNGTLETLLVPRPSKDPVWHGMLHTPGVMLRHADFIPDDGKATERAFARLEKRELGFTLPNAPEFVGIIHRMAKRGPEVVQVFVAQMPKNASLKEGIEWVAIDDLSNRPDFTQHQIPHVKLAAEYYRKHLTP